MRLKLLLIVFLSIASGKVFSQSNIGYYHDASGMPIEGTFEEQAYFPTKSVSYSIPVADSYTRGSYYNKNGKRISGLLLFKNKKIRFKKQLKDTPQRLQASELAGVTVGVDSFMVIQNFTVSKKHFSKNREKEELALYLFETKDKVFAKHLNFEGIGQLKSIRDTYLVKEKGTKTWVNFPIADDEFQKTALEYFDHIDILKRKISNGKLKAKDLETIMNYVEMDYKRKNDIPVFFNRYWAKTRTRTRLGYVAKITQTDPTHWAFSFYNHLDTLLFQSTVDAFNKQRQDGDFITYFPDGKIRKTLSFKKGQLHKLSTQNKEGTPIRSYHIKINENDSTLVQQIFREQKGNTYSFYDSVRNITFHQELQGSMVKRTYYEENGTRTYLISGGEFKYRLSPLQNIVNKRFQAQLSVGFSGLEKYSGNNKALNDVIYDNANQTILIWFKADGRGKVKQYKILNKLSLHPGLVRSTSIMLNSFSPQVSGNQNLKRYKVNGKRVSYEVVIPYTISFGRFYKSHDAFRQSRMHHHFMMNQMNRTHDMLQNIRVPTAF